MLSFVSVQCVFVMRGVRSDRLWCFEDEDEDEESVRFRRTETGTARVSIIKSDASQ